MAIVATKMQTFLLIVHASVSIVPYVVGFPGLDTGSSISAVTSVDKCGDRVMTDDRQT